MTVRTSVKMPLRGRFCPRIEEKETQLIGEDEWVKMAYFEIRVFSDSCKD